jgi:hypothetical protein
MIKDIGLMPYPFCCTLKYHVQIVVFVETDSFRMGLHFNSLNYFKSSNGTCPYRKYKCATQRKMIKVLVLASIKYF